VGQTGLVEVVYFSGVLLGGMLINFLKEIKDRMKPIIAVYFVIGITTAASGILPQTNQGFLIFMILNATCGISVPFFNTLFMSMVQQSYPAEILGRVLGVLNAICNVAGPIGLIFSGPLADYFGVESIFLISG